jgi:hypothetical protein
MLLIRLLPLLLWSSFIFAQSYQTPDSTTIPKKLDSLERLIIVSHFPTRVHAIADEKESALYHWKHNTAILSEVDEIIIEEFGAYIYYNNQWNLRTSFPAKELNKLFGTKKATLKQGQPYTFEQNWRSGSQVFGGWAMWYFIGKTSTGKRVCGYQQLETTNKILPKIITNE